MKTKLGIFRHRGIATMELALVMPILVLLVFGLIEFSTIFFVRQSMLNAAGDAARKLSISDGLSTSEAEQVAYERLASINANFNVTATEQPAFINGQFDAVVEITVPREDISLGLPLGFGREGNIAVRVVMLKEAE